MRLVARGCFQEDEKINFDSLFASAPSLVTLRLMLALVIARMWSCVLADTSTAFIHAPLAEEEFVWPPQELYFVEIEQGHVRIKTMPSIVELHFASLMVKLRLGRCKSDSNLHCHK